jgi:serine/threonine protein kinase
MAAATPAFPTWCERPNYTCVEKLGEGTFGTVYAAMDTTTNPLVKVAIKVAIKVVKAPGVVASLEKELAHLRVIRRHPFLIHYLDTFMSDDGHMCIVTELAHGGNLRTFVAQRGFLLTLRERVRLMTEILFALEYLHGLGKGITHRDIKPTNVLVYFLPMMRGGGHAALADILVR